MLCICASFPASSAKLKLQMQRAKTVGRRAAIATSARARASLGSRTHKSSGVSTSPLRGASRHAYENVAARTDSGLHALNASASASPKASPGMLQRMPLKCYFATSAISALVSRKYKATTQNVVLLRNIGCLRIGGTKATTQNCQVAAISAFVSRSQSS